MTLALECRCCAIAQRAAEHGGQTVTGNVTEDVNEDVVMISGPEFDGLLVVPRQHVSGLEELSVSGRGLLLATLQRASKLVQARHPGSATRVVPTTVPPGSPGHVCFQVLASASDEPTDLSSV
jgi:hypothetical protein